METFVMLLLTAITQVGKLDIYIYMCVCVCVCVRTCVC